MICTPCERKGGFCSHSGLIPPTLQSSMVMYEYGTLCWYLVGFSACCVLCRSCSPSFSPLSSALCFYAHYGARITRRCGTYLAVFWLGSRVWEIRKIYRGCFGNDGYSTAQEDTLAHSHTCCVFPCRRVVYLIGFQDRSLGLLKMSIAWTIRTRARMIYLSGPTFEEVRCGPNSYTLEWCSDCGAVVGVIGITARGTADPRAMPGISTARDAKATVYHCSALVVCGSCIVVANEGQCRFGMGSRTCIEKAH